MPPNDADVERRRRIDDLLDRVLELPDAERRSLLDTECAGDPELREAVEELLRLASESTAGFDRPPGEILADLATEDLGVGPGDQVGAYRLVRLLGRGGMGVVFLAERADGQYEQSVALKLVQRGAGISETVRRFELERRILARLDHPNIARLLDGGATADNVPYLVMEYVEGRAIDAYCDAERLSIDRRLELFETVARAVDHAHRNLVVHRDLKPSNILVTADGTVKLLDFGIAKLLEDDRGPALTRTLMRVLTPEYSSPEQVRGDPISTAADVYQLGLLLYRLLTGMPAQPVSASTLAALEEAVCRTQPRRPSAAVAEVDAELAARRRLSTSQWRRALRGDLDNIVLKALRKEPERRYAAAADLARDLERRRLGLPVTAQPDTVAYRTRKFVRRHRFGVAAGAAFLVLLVGYAATVTVQAGRIAAERDRAQLEARKAEEVKNFLTGLFEVSDPARSKGEEITARELLAEGSRRLADQLADQPEIRLDLLGTAGEIQRKLGLYDQAEPLLEEALILARQTLPESDLGVAQAADQLGRLRRNQGQHDEAELLLEEALAIRRQHLEENDPRVADTLEALALNLLDIGQLQRAEAFQRQALATRRAAFGEDSVEVARSLHSLAQVVRQRGDYPEAERLVRSSLALRRELLGAGDPEVIESLADLGLILRLEGHSAAAVPLYREALRLNEEVLGAEHPEVATTMTNLAVALRGVGEFDEAVELLRHALAIRERSLGERHPRVAAAYLTLGRVLQDAGDLDAAEQCYRTALERFDDDHPWRLSAELNLATLLQERGKLDEAETILRRVEPLKAAQLGSDHPEVGLIHAQLASIRAARGDLEAAVPLYEEALRIYRAKLSDDHSWLSDAVFQLGDVLRRLGRTEQAEPLLQEAVDLRSRKYGDDDPRTREARATLQSLSSGPSR